MSAPKTAPAIELGEIIHTEDLAQWLTGGGDWIEIDSPDHGAAAIAVWRMEDDSDRSPACEDFVRRLVASANVCAGVPVEVLEANASGGLPWLVADQIDARVERADMLEALRRLHDWAQAQAPNTHFSGDHPIALVRDLLQAQGVAA